MGSNMISHPRASNRRCSLVLVVRPDQIFNQHKCKGIITMKEYSGRTGIKKWLYTREDSILIALFLGIPAIIVIVLASYALWRF